MGIKDNFQQALRELTGTEKEEAKQQRDTKSVNAMKNAVAAGDTGEFDAIKEIDRRAAEAASEYDRQQRAFTEGDALPPERDFSSASAAEEPGSFRDTSFSGQPDSFSTAGESVQAPLGEPTAADNVSAADTSAGIGAQPTAGVYQQPNTTAYQQPTNAAYQQPNPGAYQQPNNAAYQQPNPSAYQQPNNAAYQQPNPGAYQQPNNAAYQQPNNGAYQQADMGGYRPDGAGTYRRPGEAGYNAGPAIDPTYEQAMIFSAARYQHTANEDDEITVISKNTVIDGNVRSFANMSVDGNIKGNIETTKDIDLNGKVVGNIACNNAQMRTSQIQGNIQMKGNAYMERDTLLIGDLTSTYANVNGKIKGNLDITGKAELKSDAVVFGDISASTITVLDGAIIQGYVSTTFLNKEESKNIFPDTITIGD